MNKVRIHGYCSVRPLTHFSYYLASLKKSCPPLLVCQFSVFIGTLTPPSNASPVLCLIFFCCVEQLNMTPCNENLVFLRPIAVDTIQWVLASGFLENIFT